MRSIFEPTPEGFVHPQLIREDFVLFSLGEDSCIDRDDPFSPLPINGPIKLTYEDGHWSASFPGFEEELGHNLGWQSCELGISMDRNVIRLVVCRGMIDSEGVVRYQTAYSHPENSEFDRARYVLTGEIAFLEPTDPGVMIGMWNMTYCEPLFGGPIRP